MIPFRIGVQQRVFPAYRAPFFDALARSCAGGLSVFAGDPMSWEALGQEGKLLLAQRVSAVNYYIGWGSFLIVWQRGMKDWLERWQPDILIMEANPRNISSTMAIRWMHKHRRPVIGWGLGAPPISRALGRLLLEPRRKFLSQFDALVSYSRTGIKQYQSTGFPSKGIFLAPNAATPKPIHPLIERPGEYKDGIPVVLFVGRLQARKRVDVLIRACARLPKNLQPRLIIVGDGPAKEEIEALAKHEYPRTEFAGARQGNALSPFYTNSDLFVLPGTGGLAVQEAMSHGLPVIVAEADGTQADLVREENGWLVPPGNEEALVSCLEQALSDPKRLRRMGSASFQIVSEEVNLERMVGVFAEVVKFVSEIKIDESHNKSV